MSQPSQPYQAAVFHDDDAAEDARALEALFATHRRVAITLPSRSLLSRLACWWLHKRANGVVCIIGPLTPAHQDTLNAQKRPNATPAPTYHADLQPGGPHP